MEQPAERRHRERLQIVQEVFDQRTGESLGHTANLNAYGMMLISINEFPLEETVRISLNIPTGKNKKIKTSLTAECRWSERMKGTELFNSGFKFIYPGRFDIEYIETLFYELSKYN